MTAAGLGKMPTTCDRRLISLFSRCCAATAVLQGQVPVGEDIFSRVFEQGGGLGKARTQPLGHLAQLHER